VEVNAEFFFARSGGIAFVFNVECADCAMRVALRSRLDVLNCVKCHRLRVLGGLHSVSFHFYLELKLNHFLNRLNA